LNGHLAATRREKTARVFDNTDHMNALQKTISKLDDEDATTRYQIEADDHRDESKSSSINQNENGERHMISWAVNDPENPYNWSFVSTVHSNYFYFTRDFMTAGGDRINVNILTLR